MVYLKDPEMFWENVGGSLSLPLLPLTTFDIDIGDAARIESIRIVDGQVRRIAAAGQLLRLLLLICGSAFIFALLLFI